MKFVMFVSSSAGRGPRIVAGIALLVLSLVIGRMNGAVGRWTHSVHRRTRERVPATTLRSTPQEPLTQRSEFFAIDVE